MKDREAARILVAGVGNVLLGDDGFGVEVARCLLAEPATLPAAARVVDFGTRAVHLAYELLEGYDGVVLVDAMARGEAPGTVFVFEPDLAPVAEDAAGALLDAPMMDAHSMHPAAVLRMALGLGARLPFVRVVGCEPADIDPAFEGSIGLSAPVLDAVERAARVVRDLVQVRAAEVGEAPRSREEDRSCG
jgi:hydrogenase maturation protease